MNKEIKRVAQIYYTDYADQYDLPLYWYELPEEQKQYWYAYAQRRMERDS